MVNGYSPTYDSNEVAEPIIDSIVGTAATVPDFASLLGLLVVLAIGAFLWKMATR